MRKPTILRYILVISYYFYLNKIFAQCPVGGSQTSMQQNNVHSFYTTEGIFWQNPSNLLAGYFIPKGSGLSTIFSGAIWIGGYDYNGSIHFSGDMWIGSGNDYYPGPLDSNATTSYSMCQDFDRFYGVSKSEIDIFLNNGIISSNILNWPGKNNPYILYLPHNQDLAPFVDLNNDEIYNPYDGDYPLVKGDTAIWWILNDRGGMHTATQSYGFGAELHILAYSFLTNDDINDMTFYDVEIFNKSTFSYNNTYVGIYMDTDIGGYLDDYVGCDTLFSVGYGYNGDSFDEDNVALGYGLNPPLQAVTMIKKPTINSQEYSMSSFISFHNSNNDTMGNPVVTNHFYNYISGRWKDGSQMVYGGNGHYSTGGTIPYSFQYSGNPADSTEWSECSEGNYPGDRKFVMSFGDFDFASMSKISMSFALVYHRPTSGSNCVGVSGLMSSVQNAHNFYNVISVRNNYPKKRLNFSIYPNPSSGTLSINVGRNRFDNLNIELYDLQGNLIFIDYKNNQDIIKINVSSFPNGSYLLRLVSDKGEVGIDKILIVN
ncbi:MAG: T9SS type A sorting domain-containing protein [Flavobacteriales bacterium]|nr:T9SS type A sorting domain-containing protein [Flavobacteriales bacterium]